jgi:hypothetical protein
MTSQEKYIKYLEKLLKKIVLLHSEEVDIYKKYLILNDKNSLYEVAKFVDKESKNDNISKRIDLIHILTEFVSTARAREIVENQNLNFINYDHKTKS